MMLRFFEKYPFFSSKLFLFSLYLLLPVIATIQLLVRGPEAYNNLQIFLSSFYNLRQGHDLYVAHPELYNDLFKYSPSFAFFMGLFYFFPVWISLFFWNLLNTLVVYWAVEKLNFSRSLKAFVLLFCAIELLNSLQSSQSNGLVAGLMIGSLALMENKKPVLAALLICFGFYIKIFAAGAGLIFIFYDTRRRFLVACIFWGILIGLAPAMIAGFDGLVQHYKSWWALLESDRAHELNFSLMTLVQRWTNTPLFGDIYFLVPAVILLLLPLWRKQFFHLLGFRLTFFASVLIWAVIFNHKAESPTYVIAMFGAALWALAEEPSWKKTALLLFVFIFTGLAASDIFPLFIRREFFVPYAIKAFPCIVLWLAITWKLIRRKQFQLIR